MAKFTPVWKPYLYDAKRLHTHFGVFDIQSFDVPHNGVDNRAFIITVDGTKILYATDYEYIPYNLSKRGINIALIELNYQSERVTDMDEHRRHTVLGHAEENTVIELVSTINLHLRKVILCHMSKSGALDRDKAMKHIKEVLPEYVDVTWAKPGEEYNISEIPF